MTKTKTKPEKEQVLKDTDTAIYEIPKPPELEIGDPLLIFLSTDSEKFFTDDYVNGKELRDKTLEQIKRIIHPNWNFFSVVTMIILYMPAIFYL